MRLNEREVAWCLHAEGETSRLAPAGAWVLGAHVFDRNQTGASWIRPCASALRVVTGA